MNSPEFRKLLLDPLLQATTVCFLLIGDVWAQNSLEQSAFLSGETSSGSRFTLLTGERTGIDFVPPVDVEHPTAYLYHSGMTCSGIAAGDIDGDGRPDLFLANGSEKNALYLQTGKAFHFEDVTASAGVGIDGGDAWASGVALVDMDNDGDLDLYICNYQAANQLFINLGPSENARVHFKECAKEAGVDTLDASHFPAFADYDNDGDLDLYLVTNRIVDPRGGPAELPVDFPQPGKPKLREGEERYYELWVVDADNWGTEPMGKEDYLFRNEGVGENGVPKFSDVTEESGIAGRGDGLSCVWWDSDRDGDQDLYVCNDFRAPDRFYQNEGDGTFTDVIAKAVPHCPWFSMGSDYGDLDNDGDFDLMVADMSATSHYKSKVTMGVMGGMDLFRANNSTPPQYMRNTLYLNDGENEFREGAYLAGLASSDWTWSIKMADFDADGLLDIYFTNGVPREMNHSDIVINEEDLVGRHAWEFFKDGKLRKEQNTVYRNQGNLDFEDVSQDWGLDHLGASYGSVLADFDQDGDLDLAVMNLEENITVYRNDGASGSQLTISLRGKKSNRQGIGATLEVTAGENTFIRQMNPATGYSSYNQDLVHFGFGDLKKVDQLTIRWPSGIVQTIKNPALNHHLVITEEGEPVKEGSKSEPLFVESSALEDLFQQENEFDDFSLQPLLPHRLSTEGPAMAWGDVNGDQLPDVFLGGAANAPAELRFASTGGQYLISNQPAFFEDLAGEDVAAEFADFDGDGDLDLFVARGSYEFKEGDPVQKNALYLNDGNGKFTASKNLPDQALNTGSLALADFDQDGDLDVFLGSRVKHAEYPLSVPSSLWINDQGVFSDQTEALAPELKNAGLVTAAQWAELNGDKFLDLILAREWGSIAVYFNEKGTSLKRSTSTGELESQTGWWSSLVIGDIDGDGDADLIAGNLGLNTKYKTSAKKPMTLYYGDFDQSGKRHIVEVKREGKNVFPERGRSCSSNAMPFISKKFGTFHDFGVASLTDIYSDEKLKAAREFKAITFEHAVFLNDGNGQFSHRALPKITQIAPVGSIALHDLDGDSDLDLVLGQNFLGPQSETGNYDGGLSQLLINGGKGDFATVGPTQSALNIRDAANAIHIGDLNGDKKPDLAIGTNDGPLRLYFSK